MSKSGDLRPPLVGRPAPDFALLCTLGSERSRRTIRRDDYGGGWLILMFYPRDFSLICPTELSAISDRYDEFRKRGADLLAVSTDSVESHERWMAMPKAQGGLGPVRFPLGSDPGGDVALAYQSCAEPQRVALRGLVIIDPASVIQYQVVHNMSVGRRTEDVERVLTALQTGGMCPENWVPGAEKIDPGTRLKPGNVISHYVIEETIGSGSFATVFRAYDQVLQRKVALKIIRQAEDEPPRVHEEARAAAALNHPNVCTVHGIDDSEGIVMIVMEYLSGRTLDVQLGDGPMPRGDVIRIGSQIAAGVAAAHDAGVVHGDLKPANIFITDGERVKILDFGLAGRKRIPEPGDITLPPGAGASLAGTPAYMAPEQARGEPATSRSDTFALGLVLYEMLAGKRSFADRNQLQVLEEIRSTDPVELANRAPAEFRPLLCRLLVRNPAARTIRLREIEGLLRGNGYFLPRG